MEIFQVPKNSTKEKFTLNLASNCSDKWFGKNRKIPGSLFWWESKKLDISKKENFYSRCWELWTRCSIETLFSQWLNHGAATFYMSSWLWHSNIQEEKGVCHNQEIGKNKQHYIQFLLFIAKEKEILKQNACVNSTLNEIKEFSQVFGDQCFLRSAVCIYFIEWC